VGPGSAAPDAERRSSAVGHLTTGDGRRTPGDGRRATDTWRRATGDGRLSHDRAGIAGSGTVEGPGDPVTAGVRRNHGIRGSGQMLNQVTVNAFPPVSAETDAFTIVPFLFLVIVIW